MPSIRSTAAELQTRIPARGRRWRSACSCAANICTSPRATRGMRVYDVASVGNKGVSQGVITAPFSPAGSGHAHSARRRHLRRAADQSADQSGAQRRRQDARRQSGVAVSSAVQLRLHHRRQRGADPDQHQYAGGRRAAQQFPQTRGDLESRWRAQWRAPSHDRRLQPLHHDAARHS